MSKNKSTKLLCSFLLFIFNFQIFFWRRNCYDILENTVVLKNSTDIYDKNGKFSNANELADEVDKITYSIEQNGHYLDTDIAQNRGLQKKEICKNFGSKI